MGENKNYVVGVKAFEVLKWSKSFFESRVYMSNSFPQSKPDFSAIAAAYGVDIALLDKPIEDVINLSVGSKHMIKQISVFYIGELVQKSEEEILLHSPNKRRALNEVKEQLSYLGLHLGMTIETAENNLPVRIPVEKLYPYLSGSQRGIIFHFLQEKQFQDIDQVEAEINAPNFRFPNFGKRAYWNLKAAIGKVREESATGLGLSGLQNSISDQIVASGIEMTGAVESELKKFIRFLNQQPQP